MLGVHSLWLVAIAVLCFLQKCDAANQGDVRLVNGPNPFEGRVEYYHNGAWFSLCYPYIDSNDYPYKAICRQLGYQADGAMGFYGNSYGAAPGETFRGYIYCRYGTETSLSQCRITEADVNCNPLYALGVSCDSNVTVSSSVRLRDGGNTSEGRLEIFTNGVWGSVCKREDHSYIYHHINADLACREMFGPGHGGSYFLPWESPVEILQSGAILKRNLRCSGDEDSLIDCPHNSVSYTCTHEDDVTMECYPVPEGCGGHHAELKGTIQSPGYPHGHSYTHDTNCTWIISSPSYTHFQLSFPHIEASESPSGSDYIYVIDTNGLWVLASSTGNKISNISTYNRYPVFVRLQTPEGATGIKFTASWAVTCETSFTLSADYIYSPGWVGSYPPNIDCTYTIRRSAGYNIRLTFNTFSLDSGNGTQCTDFLQVYDGDSDSAPVLGGPFCGSTVPQHLTSTQHVVTIKFHSDGITDNALRRFRMYYTSYLSACNRNFTSSGGYIYSPGYPGPYPSDLDCFIFIRQIAGYVIRLQFNVFSLDEEVNSTCLDSVQVYDGDNTSAPALGGPYCGSKSPSLLFSSQNNMMIRFRADGNTSATVKGFEIYYVRIATACDGTFTSSWGYINSPGYSGSYPPNMDCTYIVRQRTDYTIRLQFYWFTLDPPNNGTCSDFIKVYDGDSESASVLGGPYCGSVASTLRSTQNVVLIKFQSDNITSTSTRRFRIRYEGYEPAPIVTYLNNDTGMVASPDYPNLYNNETDYVWYITASKQYSVIVLTFHDFTTRDCNSMLQIRDGTSGGTITNICGAGLPNPVRTTGNVMYLRLVSTPSSTTQTGNLFNASWTTECEQTFTSQSGAITSPEYPAPYPPNMECGIIIRQSPGYFVTLDFTAFHLDEPASDICEDFVEVRDGSSDFFPLLGGPYCGTSLPPSLSSTQDWVFVRFNSDNVTSANSTGFRANYQRTECKDRTMTDREGNFTSPGFPLQFPGNSYCIWTMTVHPDDVIELTFDQFYVWCDGAYVRLYDSHTTDVDRVIDTFCGSNNPPKITTRSNSLTVVLSSFGYSPSYAYGFRASYVSIDQEDADVSQYDLFPYGLEQEDTQIWPTEISMTNVELQAGFPFGKETQTTVYIGNNGIISIGRPYHWPRLHSYRMAICAYCAYIDNSDTTGGIFYHVYGESDTEIIKKATGEIREFSQSREFTASTALVVTWDRVKQGRYSGVDAHPENEEGEATFQIALITDGFETHVLVYYLTGAMTWRYRGRWSYVIMGYSDGKRVQPSLYSKTRNAYSIDSVTGNTGRKGIWIYKVGELPLTPDQTCQNWYFRNLIVDRSAGFAQLPRCPCAASDVWRRTRFMWTFSRWIRSPRMWCYRLNLAASRRFFPFGKECCYSYDSSNPLTYERLVMNEPYAGSAQAYNPSIFALRPQYEREDREGHEACCLKARYKDIYCRLYYQLRPVGECRANIPFRFSWLFGDPHIKTLDDREYTFNGWGEYTLVTLDNANVTFTLQGRTGRLELGNETLANATIFTAFGAEENGTRVFVGLHPVTKDSLEIYADRKDYSRRFQDEGEDFDVDADNFTMFRDNNSVVISFPSGITLAVALGNRTVAVSVSIPVEYRNQTKGLLGNYNGVISDEFVLPNGTVLDDNMSDRDIHYLFGQKWAVTEANSVLRYGRREGHANYSHPEFEPFFLDEVPETVQRSAVENLVCKENDTACIYDYIVTGSAAFAGATSDTGDQATKENALARNSLPELEVPANVTVMTGQLAVFQVVASDADGDEVTYEVADDDNGMIQVDPSYGNVTANISSQKPILLYAVDSKDGQSTVREITIVMCSGCNGQGQCDHTKMRPSVGTLTYQHAVCACDQGWAGDDCEHDRDACLDSPCDPLQNCTDLSPADEAALGRGFNCSDCPSGYELSPSDGSNQCLDVDECADDTLNDCQQWCNNTDGGFECLCDDGYRLSYDEHSCIDINECAERSDNCQHECNNTDGGFECLCYEGYSYDENYKNCTQDTGIEVCKNHGCTQGCRAVSDPTKKSAECFCYAGYDLDEDGKTCKDHDECEDGICAQMCNNTVGSFSCSCYTGYQLNADQRTCSPCPSLTYGPECSLNCTCSGRGVGCHPVRGCICQDGWTGSDCKVDVNECEVDPDVCGTEMRCNNNEGSFTCSCRAGYELDGSGKCTDVDECSSSAACGELERCINVPGTYICECQRGYQLDNGTCTDIDECSKNGGGCQQLCVNKDGSYNCECFYGYLLNSDRSSCSKQANVEPCSNSSCDHGCTLDESDNRETCFCLTGFELQNDKKSCLDINECEETGASNCSHTCTNTEGGFICSCPLGMTLGNDHLTCDDCPGGTWGENCAHHCDCGPGADVCNVTTGCVCNDGWTGDKCNDDVNECQTEEGLRECRELNAECFNFRGGYDCRCREGFTRQHNTTCEDINECDEEPCSQRCENSPGSYRCLCYQGFSLDDSTGDCTDIDECRLSVTHGCTQGCQNTPGSYRCFCHRPGYVLANDGSSCIAKTECTETQCDTENGGCMVQNGNETCFCNSGYELEDPDGVKCTFIKVEWCKMGTCDHKCQESSDGKTFTCSCYPGYLLNDDRSTCRACPEGTFGENCSSKCTCNSTNTASCNPVDGTCNCRQGWGGDECGDDVNECDQKLCGENADCLNTPGSYICTCKTGYVKDADQCEACPDGFYGEECKSECNCDGVNVQSCDNVHGTCRCKPGWEGKSCDDDINECERNAHNCSVEDNLVCVNSEGSFSCVCQQNYTMNEDGRCVGIRHLKFEITVDIDFNGNLSAAFEVLKDEAGAQFFAILKEHGATGLLAVIVKNIISRGSLIFDNEGVVEDSKKESSAASLVLALIEIRKENIFVLGYNGSVTGVKVGGMNASDNTSACELYEEWIECAEGEICHEEGGVPTCSLVKLTNGSDLLLIICLSTGIPLVVVLVCVVVACGFRRRAGDKKKDTDQDSAKLPKEPAGQSFYSTLERYTQEDPPAVKLPRLHKDPGNGQRYYGSYMFDSEPAGKDNAGFSTSQ